MGVKVREKVPGSGEWWVFINYNRKRRAQKVGSLEAAEETARKVQEKIAAKELRIDSPEEAKRVLLREYAKKWMAGHVEHNLKAATKISYQDKLDRYILPAFGSQDMKEITRGEVRDFCHKLMAGGLSAASVKVTLIIVSSVFNHAIEDGLISENPAGKPGRYLKVPSGKGKAEFLTPEEGAVLLAATRQHRPRLHPLFLAALRTGMRGAGLPVGMWTGTGNSSRSGGTITTGTSRARRTGSRGASICRMAWRPCSPTTGARSPRRPSRRGARCRNGYSLESAEARSRPPGSGSGSSPA
jgi:integrase